MTGPESTPPEAIWAVYALTRRGAELARRVARGLRGGAVLWLPRRLAADHGEAARYFDSLGEALADDFSRRRGHVIVGATGMVVRLIAPLLVSKKTDPAVVVLPQDGRFAISLLSGHLGGGNLLALQVAELVGGQAVISTATDVEGLPALEMLARDLGLAIEDFSKLPAVARRLVDGSPVPVHDPDGFLAPHLAPWADHFRILDQPPPPDAGPHIRVDYRLEPAPGPEALVLRPPAFALGLGCHRGIDRAEVEEIIDRSLGQAGLARASAAALATVETRSDEPAFLELSRIMDRPLIIYTKEELSRVATPNPSGKVLERIGVPSVCEAAAMLAARTDRLIISKQKSGRATLAAALCLRPRPRKNPK